MVSVSAPCPSTILPFSSSRTVTRACASVPPVTACTGIELQVDLVREGLADAR